MVRMVALLLTLLGLVYCGSPDQGKDRRTTGAARVDRRDLPTEDLLYRRARSSLQSGQVDQAIRFFDALLEKYPRSPRREEVGYLLADAYFRWAEKDFPQRFQQVIDAFQQALQFYPSSPKAPQARLRLAEIYWRAGLYYEALAVLEMLLESVPPDPYLFEAKSKKASYLLKLERYREALQVYQELLASPQPTDKPMEVFLGYADAAFSLGDFVGALEGYRSVLGRFPDRARLNPLISFRFGETLFKNKRFKEAREVFELLVEGSSKASFGHQLLARIGDCYLEEGDIQGAMVSYVRGIARFPGTEGALISQVRLADIGLRYKGLKIPQGNKGEKGREKGYEAYLDPLAAYDRVAHARPDHPLAELAWYKRSVALRDQERYEQAANSFKEGLSRYPKSFLRNDAWFALKDTLERSIQHAHSRAEWDKAIKIYRANKGSYLKGGMERETLMCLAESYEKLALGEKAAELYSELLDLFPKGSKEDVRVRLGLGRTYFLLKDYSSALDILRELPANFPRSPHLGEVYRLLGDSLRHQGDCRGAREAYEQAVRIGLPSRVSEGSQEGIAPEIDVQLGNCYRRSGQGPQAIELYRKSVQAYPLRKETPRLPLYVKEGYLGLADSLYALERYREALEIYSSLSGALAGDTRLFGTLYRMADCYWKLGEKGIAGETWRSLAGRKDGGPWARLASRNLEEMSWTETYNLR